MFHEGGGKLPPGVRTRSPEDVAAAVERAIVTGRAEIDVADLPTKIGTMLGQLAPQTAARLGRMLGADRVARELAEGHRDKR
jgi:hypothetical protein